MTGPSLGNRNPRLDIAVKLLLILSSILLLGGIFAPMMTLTKFVWISNQFSLFSATVQLLRDGQYLLFVVLFLFSIVLPLAKLVLLYRFWHDDSATRAQIERFMNWLSHYGKWSMLDVFVVAILLVTVKLGVLATVVVHVGLYLYACAGLLIMLTTALVNTIAARELGTAG
jgi:paraquat-inducible protein A